MKQRPGGNAWPRGPPVVAGHPARMPARMTAAGLTRPAGTTTEPRQRPVRRYRGSTWKCPGRPVLCLWTGRTYKITIPREVKNQMKVIKTDNNNNHKRAMTLAELEALAQFEASDRKGQAVFHPRVGPDSPAPHYVALLEGLTRIVVTHVDGEHWVEDGQWYRRDDESTVTPIGDVLERCWQAAMAVRSRLKEALGIKAYVVSAAVFTGMEPDESIVAAAASRSTRVLFGMDDHVERLAALPGEQDLQYPLQARSIPDEAEALSRQPAATAAEPETASLDVGDDRVVIHAGAVHVDTVNVYITIVAAPNGGGNDGDGLPTVQDR